MPFQVATLDEGRIRGQPLTLVTVLIRSRNAKGGGREIKGMQTAHSMVADRSNHAECVPCTDSLRGKKGPIRRKPHEDWL